MQRQGTQIPQPTVQAQKSQHCSMEFGGIYLKMFAYVMKQIHKNQAYTKYNDSLTQFSCLIINSIKNSLKGQVSHMLINLQTNMSMRKKAGDRGNR